jgi:hypothetical protein
MSGNPKATEIHTNELCNYGCSQPAKFKFASGKLCCSQTTTKCPALKQKKIETAKNNIDKFGRNTLQRGQYAAHLKKLETGGYIRAGNSISASKNKLLEDGSKQCDISNKKMQQTKLTVGEDGLTNAQRSARKAADTRLNDIDASGLNQYERWTLQRIQDGTFDDSFEKAKQVLHEVNTGLRYQGSYELNFINSLKSKFGVEWVKQKVFRGPSIQYVDCYGKTRWYLSDFIIENVVYEIKSEWTWNRRGNDKILEQNNINKLIATKKAGYDVKLIREGKEIDYATITG